MKTGAAYGRELDNRLKAVIQTHKEGLEAARKDGDLEKEKFVLEGCQYIDSLHKTAYSISQEFDTLQKVGPIAKPAKKVAARVFEASIMALEARALKINGASKMEYVKTSMGAVTVLTEIDFFPDGPFKWWDPADWIRQANWEQYHAVQIGLNELSTVTQSSASAAQDVVNKAAQTASDAAKTAADAAGSTAVKYTALGLALLLGYKTLKSKIK